MGNDWRTRIRQEIDEACLLWDETSRAKLSTDYHHFSPVLVKELQGKMAECIVSPRNEKELETILAFAAEEKVPVTVRGNGTGNYGQCVPLTGGIVVHFARMNRIAEIGDGYMIAEPGARMGRMEQAARAKGQEMLAMPSTYQSATIGGFLNGGFGGIGSIRWGTIWDGMVQSMKLKTIESPPATLYTTGNDMLPYLHTYGTVGVLAEVRVKLAPRVEWMQLAATFARWQDAVRFAQDVAADDAVGKRLVSAHEWPIPRYFQPLRLPEGRSAVLLEIDERHEAAVRSKCAEWNGSIELTVPAEKYHKGTGVSDFSWNHTTLWARKADPDMTYLQTTYSWDRLFEQMAALKAEFPEYINHLEFNRSAGQLRIAGLPLMRFESADRLNRIIDRCRELGVAVSNPHTWDLEDGGRSYEHHKLWELKRRNDPHLLLNPMKLRPAAGQAR